VEDQDLVLAIQVQKEVMIRSHSDQDPEMEKEVAAVTAEDALILEVETSLFTKRNLGNISPYKVY
jgi:hypothetical protein